MSWQKKSTTTPSSNQPHGETNINHSSSISYESPKTTNPKKTSLTIDIDEELARLELDEFVHSLEPPAPTETSSSGGGAVGGGHKGHKSEDDVLPVHHQSDSRRHRDHESEMENSKLPTTVNGSVVQQSGGPPPAQTAGGGGGGRREGKKVPTDLTIPGSVVDTPALRSELLVAVEQNKVEKVRRILKAGVDTNAICDDKGRWPLHIATLLGFTEVSKLLLEHGAQKDQPDTALERTPLLYAAATSSEIVQLLLNYKVDIHAVNKFGATCLHYAAGSGQSECCRILASVGCNVNARDKQKMTPLHMAARVDDIWSIEVLLEFGADIHAKDSVGKTALHHAAETSEGMISDHKKMGATFRRLVAAGISVNAMDNDGKIALYYAIQTGSPEACTILRELGAEMIDGVSMLVMGRKFPSLIRPFLDKCISSNIDTCDPESKHFYIQFDYTCLTFYPKDISDDKLQTMQHREETESILQEMGVLYSLTWCKDSSILSHPVCESLLRLKWKKVKWYLYLDMLLFAVFLAFLTAVIFMEYESDSSAAELAAANLTETTGSGGVDGDGISEDARAHIHNRSNYYCMDTTRNIVVWVILWILTACLGIREMIQLLQAPLHYVVQVENLLELVLVFSVAMLSLAECGVQSFVNTRDHFAAVCLIVTLYGKIPVFGVYIRMFAAVAVNILKCMFTYLGLLFAFSLTLHFLFRSQKEFDSVGFTFLKTFAMMIGEIELVRTFIENDGTYIVPVTSHLMFALFIIFISVILMCLLIALAVSDIASMQREGEHMQLVQQVKVASQLEDALQHRALLYPQFGMREIKSLHQRKGVIFPNLKDHGKLGKDALEIVITQHTRKMDASNTNVISQQIHPSSSEENETINKLINQNTRSTTELTDDLLQKLKTRMDLYTLEVERRNDKLVQDVRIHNEHGNSVLANEILVLKSQLDHVTASLREIGSLVKNIAERSSPEGSASPVEEESRRDGRHHHHKPSTTGTSPTSPDVDVEGTDATSSESTPERSTTSNTHAQQQNPTNNP
ncbi:Transient receptor potential channel pyrexia [Folsomia candida]|uniref:Transient receptor potential channel pyrexia n=1 Tax=Folsomia candida TaxID=158441 RepID=A0A226DIT7_FOLCA|nr:Transient receptor potential channel pyrexia [Folsomia candida]